MNRSWLVSLTLLLSLATFVFIHHHQPLTTTAFAASTASTASTCIDIPASPDYLSTGDAHDAIAAINHAHQLENLPPISLPTDFYTLDPAAQQLLLVNRERTVRGLRPLQSDANLSHLALAYSKQLLDLNFFSHTSPISGTFSDRINSNPAIANHYSTVAENLAGNPVPGIGPIYEYMYDDTVEQCGHRHNILNPSLTLVGINWMRGSSYGSISVQEFLTPAPWNPYHGQGVTPITNTAPPYISITATTLSSSAILQCEAFTSNNPSVTRITWFLDTLKRPLHIGASWQLQKSQLSPGIHTLLAYAVDTEQMYSVARYTLLV